MRAIRVRKAAQPPSAARSRSHTQQRYRFIAARKRLTAILTCPPTITFCRKSRSVGGAVAALPLSFSLRPTAPPGPAAPADVTFHARCKMKTRRTGTGMVIGLAVGLLTGALSGTRAHADQGMMQKTSPTSAERMTSETFVVSGIDRAKRTVTLTNAEGERNTMSVRAEVKAFDSLKVGDRVDVDYL